MSIIEQAAQRLEQLRKAGVQVPAPGTVVAAPLGLQPAAAGAHLEAIVAPAPVAVSRFVDLDLARLQASGYVVPEAPRSLLADEFRVIKRPLLANIRGESAAPIHRANCIMVTSSVPGEGKTFTALNLALSMAAEVDSRVLLIDCDVLRPSVFERLGLDKTCAGLLDKLNRPELTLSDLIWRTNIDKLSLLSSGPVDQRATEKLASDAMRSLVDEIASRYSDRIIIFDTPPLLAAPETRILASLVGQIVVVVEAQRTQQREVLEAMALIESCPVVLMMLNKVLGKRQGGYGHYGYGINA